MWELIQSNKRKTFILFIGMGVILILVGYFAGGAYAGAEGGFAGILLALFLWGLLSLLSYFGGSRILLSVSNAKKVTPDVHPRLFNVVEEMKIASNMPAMPDIYIINEEAPNAFATGIKPEKSAVAVTAGLLAGLNRDELQGVIAHEISHIINRDILLMTFAGVMLGSITIISEVFLRSLWYSGGSRYKSKSSKSSGQAQLVLMIVAIVFAILGPIFARLLYFAISRRREYLADASAVRLTRYPEGLASALEKISQTTTDLKSANKVTAGMYIVNPLKKKGMKLSDLTSTHPPISERIKILRSMMHGAGLKEYQKAYIQVKGKSSTIIPPSGLNETVAFPIKREITSVVTDMNSAEVRRNTGDLMMKLEDYKFLNCSCGLKLKIPPHFEKNRIICPRCGKNYSV
ncbi:MAG: hypothetical protein Kow0098_19170 [Ignavibacteriaceae bacterium]